MDAGEIERLIKQNIPDAEIRIRDIRGDGQHYAAEIISPSFENKTRVQQHQMVYKAIEGKMGDNLPALAIQTSMPEQGR